MTNKELLYCADCVNCKVIKQFNKDNSTYIKKIRCSKKQWLYPSGKEKLYEYFTLPQHRVKFCKFYEPMSESKDELQDYIKNLLITLPRNRIIYDAKTGKEVELWAKRDWNI